VCKTLARTDARDYPIGTLLSYTNNKNMGVHPPIKTSYTS